MFIIRLLECELQSFTKCCLKHLKQYLCQSKAISLENKVKVMERDTYTDERILTKTWQPKQCRKENKEPEEKYSHLKFKQ